MARMLPIRRSKLPEPAARWGKTFLLSTAVGIISGLAAAGLHYALQEGVDHLIGHYAHVGSPRIFDFRWQVLLLPAIGGLLSGLIVAWICPRDHGHGTNQAIAAFHQHGGALPMKGPSTKAVATIGVISCGGSAGPEGPVAALGAAIGSTTARLLSLSPQQRRVLLIAGCGGGIGAIFQCPLGGALFAASVLYRDPEFEAESIVPAFISSVVSYSTFMIFYGFGHHLLHDADKYIFQHPLELIPYAVLGPLCGALSIFFYFCVRGIEARPLQQLNLPQWLAPGLGGLIVGLLGCALPQIMDARYEFTQRSMDGSLFDAPGSESLGPWAWVALFGAIMIVKCIATALTVGTGAAGGVLGPSVFIGGVAGAFLGALLHALMPGTFLDDDVLRQSLVPVGMAGVLAAAMRTPLAAIVMVTEMTGSYGLIVPLMLVCVTSYVVGRRWGLNDAQVRSAAESPAHAGDALVHMLEAWHVRDLMERDWPHTVSPSTTLGEILGSTGSGSRPVFAVVDDGSLEGVISVPDISRVMDEPMIGDIVIASDIMVTRLTTVRPDDDLYNVLETFRTTNHEALPVVSDGPRPRFVGMLSRQAIHRAVRSESERMRAYLHAEHAGIAAIEQDEQLYQLVLGVSAPKPDTIQRMPVPHDAVGKSLREADFRRRHGAQVVGIQNENGTLQCPPDIDAPLQREQLLLVILSQPSAPAETD